MRSDRMKFKDYTYERPDFEKLAERIDELTRTIQDESDIERIQEAIHEINEIKNKVSTMENLAYIRNSINTQDKFYEDEIAAINELRLIDQAKIFGVHLN